MKRATVVLPLCEQFKDESENSSLSSASDFGKSIAFWNVPRLPPSCFWQQQSVDDKSGALVE
jgi:hypothetical protein